VITPPDTLATFVAQCLLGADGATNSQLGALTYIGSAATLNKQGTAAVDSTGGQDLSITVDWSLAETQNTVRIKHVVLELLKIGSRCSVDRWQFGTPYALLQSKQKEPRILSIRSDSALGGDLPVQS